MAITVKEINEKQFTLVKNAQGYNPDEVDNFLDELAAQTDALIRENLAYKQSVAAANAQIASLRSENEALVAEKAAQPEVEDDPAFNEPSYFKNLETTLRETLISAQRIADETVENARKQAAKIVEEAEIQAANLTSDATQKLENANAEFAALKESFAEYHRNFSALVDGQAKLLSESPLLG